MFIGRCGQEHLALKPERKMAVTLTGTPGEANAFFPVPRSGFTFTGAFRMENDQVPHV